MCGDGIHWIECPDGNVPSNAVLAGLRRNGEELYIGRVRIDDSIAFGKVHRSQKCIYVTIDGTERALDNFEILVIT